MPVGTVAYREQNHVPLVPLHVLEVFDKQRLFPLVGGALEFLFDEHGGEKALHRHLLRGREGHDADARLCERSVRKSAPHFLDEGFRLLFVLLGDAAVINAVLHVTQGDFGLHRVRGGEGIELVAVVHDVREGNEALVLASVVPGQMLFGHTERKAVVQYALEVLDFEVLLIHIIGIEERGRRELFGVSHHHRAPAAGDCPDRLCGGHLGRLVEHHEVEEVCRRRNVLRHRDRAHEHTGRKPGQKMRNVVEEFAERKGVRAGLCGLLEGDDFEAQRALRVHARNARGEPAQNLLTGQPVETLARLAVLLDAVLDLPARKRREHLVLPGQRVDIVAEYLFAEAGEQVFARERTGQKGLDGEVQTQFFQFFRGAVEAAPALKKVRVLRERGALFVQKFKVVVVQPVIVVRDTECRVEVGKRTQKVLPTAQELPQNGKSVLTVDSGHAVVEERTVVFGEDLLRLRVQAVEFFRKFFELFRVPLAAEERGNLFALLRDELLRLVDAQD